MPLRDRMRRYVARWSGAGGFFAWWWRSLLAWLPRRWRLALGMDRGRLLLQPDGDVLQLRLQDGDGVRELARMPVPTGAGPDETRAMPDPGEDPDALAGLLSPPLSELPRWLLLPAAAGLRRRLSLPLAAAERLRDVVAFEIDRQTPFTADAVAFDARILERGDRDDDGRFTAELVVVPRQALARQQAALGPLAASLAGIDVAGADGTPLGINLLPATQRRQQDDPWRTWNWVLGAVAVVAVVAAMWQVLDNRDRAEQALQARADREATRARQVSLQRQQLVDLVDGRAFLDQRRSAQPTSIEVLDALARRLPDNTYLEKLALEDGHLLLIGLSSEASSLVGKLEGAKPWRSPALTGALQPDPRSGRDRFTLTADLAVRPVAGNGNGNGSASQDPRQEAGDADAGAD